MGSISDRRVGVVGLGLMGTAITERLLTCGFVPVVWNRTRDKADRLLELGAVWSDHPFADCERIIVSLFSSEVVSEVLKPRLSEIRTGQIVIDTTTGDPHDSIALESLLLGLGASYLDAPISGSSEQTRRGEATVIVSGNKHVFDACGDLWSVLGRSVFHVGECGNAAKIKLVSNLVLGLNRAALAEGLAFAESLGLDPKATLQVLQGSAAYSRQMDTKGMKMIERDYRPQAKLSQHLKDVRLMLQAAQESGLSLRLCDTHRALLEHAEAMGLGESDNSSIVEAMRSPTR